MEYHFSVTRRLIAIFMIFSCLFLACVFFLGFELGKKLSGKGADGLTGLKNEMTQKIEQEISAASALKGGGAVPMPTVDKKSP